MMKEALVPPRAGLVIPSASGRMARQASCKQVIVVMASALRPLSNRIRWQPMGTGSLSAKNRIWGSGPLRWSASCL
jgi:hypothetical protein